MTADGERRKDRAGRQLVHQREQRAGVVRRAVGDAHAQLEHQRLIQ